MSKKKNYILIASLLTFSIYCSLTIGQGWDESYHLAQGKITLDYLFSLGENNKTLEFREIYSAMFWSIKYFIIEIFPSKYKIEISHLINLSFSLGAIFGACAICREIFNKKLSKVVFLILFFYPIFFGHMSFNSKDTILAFSHVWIFYLILRYLKNQNLNRKNYYVPTISVLAALATGIQLFFLSTLLPIVLLGLLDIFIFKKFINNNFSKIKFLFDLIKFFLLFYTLLILFWIDVHPNIILLPFTILYDYLNTLITGWPYNLINGTYFLSYEVPKSYLLINIIYKSPEYFLITYIIFVFLLIFSNDFFKIFNFFNYKLLLIFGMMLMPHIILFLIPFPVYDGMRLFLWVVPYYCIIPGIVVYYLFENFKKTIPKITSLILLSFFSYFLFSFFTITPYQYTYLNILNGDPKIRYKNFENDYWGASIKELVEKSDFKNDKTLTLATCGIENNVLKKNLRNLGIYDFKITNPQNAEFIIMTNRIVDKNNDMINCFDKFSGINVTEVKRNGSTLSVIRKIKL